MLELHESGVRGPSSTSGRLVEAGNGNEGRCGNKRACRFFAKSTELTENLSGERPWIQLRYHLKMTVTYVRTVYAFGFPSFFWWREFQRESIDKLNKSFAL